MEIKKIREVCDVYQPKTISKKEMVEDGEFDVFGANGIIGKYDKYNHEESEVLLGCRGSCGVVNISNKKSWINGNSMVIHPKNNNLSKEYLYYFLKTINYNDGIITGTSQPQITGKSLDKIEIPIPSLDEQKNIVEKMKKIETAIINQQSTLEDYDNLLKAKFNEMFGDLRVNNMNWDSKPFGDLISYMADIGSNGANATITENLHMKDEEDYALMVRTVNLNANDYSTNVKYIDKKGYDFFKKSQIFGGELIMNKIGSPGQLWIMPNLNRPVSLALNLFLMRLKENLNTTFAYYQLKSAYGEMQIKSRIMGAVTKSITKTTVKEIPIFIPPIEKQIQFESYVNTVKKQIEITKNNIAFLNKFYKIKQKELFN